MSSSRLRIAILAHSTNPRGGVVHALALADALAELGHRPVVHAPDPTGKGFFRRSVAATRSVPTTPTSGDVVAMVERGGAQLPQTEGSSGEAYA